MAILLGSRSRQYLKDGSINCDNDDQDENRNNSDNFEDMTYRFCRVEDLDTTLGYQNYKKIIWKGVILSGQKF